MTVITFTALHIAVLMLSIVWSSLRSQRREGAIALPDDDEVVRVRNRATVESP